MNEITRWLNSESTHIRLLNKNNKKETKFVPKNLQAAKNIIKVYRLIKTEWIN